MTDWPDTQWQIDADGRVLKVSEVWLEIVGRSAAEAPGYCWLDYVHEDDQTRVQEEVAAHFAARRSFALAFRARHQTGRVVWVHSGGRPLADGGYLGWTRIARGDLRLVERVAQAVCFALVIVA